MDRGKRPQGWLNEEQDGWGGPTVAIIVATVLDTVASLIAGLVLLVFYSSILGLQGLSGKEIEKAFQALDYHAPLVWCSMALGIYITFRCGAVCAWISGRARGYRPVGFYIMLTILFGLLMQMGETINLVHLALATVANIMAAFIGARRYFEGKG